MSDEKRTTPFVSEGQADMEYAMKVFTLIPNPTNHDYLVAQLRKYQDRWIADKANAKP